MSITILAQRGAVVNIAADRPFIRTFPQIEEKHDENPLKNPDFWEKLRKRKIESTKIAKKLWLIHEKERSARMKACNSVVEVGVCPCCGKPKIVNAHLCRDRLCPTCGYLLSVKRYNDMVQALSAIDCDSFDWRFITLTVRNCAPDQLATTIDQMMKAWSKFSKRRYIQSIIKGSARSMEITYNRHAGTFHPHVHVLVAFQHGAALSALQVGQFWRESMDLDYTPIVDVEVPYSKSENVEPLSSAIVEAFKYAVKSKEVADMPLSAFAALSAAVKGRNMVGYSGVIRKARKEVGLNEADEVAEDVSAAAPTCCGVPLTMVAAKWSFEKQQFELIEKAVLKQ